MAQEGAEETDSGELERRLDVVCLNLATDLAARLLKCQRLACSIDEGKAVLALLVRAVAQGTTLFDDVDGRVGFGIEGVRVHSVLPNLDAEFEWQVEKRAVDVVYLDHQEGSCDVTDR